jgi:tetratricopeptide (TPR) repeat protein
VATFGVPVAREDDALRALRAATELRERLEDLNDGFEHYLGIRLQVRTGVNTGEVVVGEATRILGGDAIVVEELEPLELKGKAEPGPAYRLVRVLPHASPYGRRDDAPLVGRRRELALLRGALDRAVSEQRCELVTVVGAAGVGKSRLVRELLAPLDDVRVLVGRCAAYGEGITFLPLAEALAPVLGSDPRAGAAAVLAGEERAGHIADHVASTIASHGSAPSTDEAFWAIRMLLEALARERPLVVVVDDVHWAEPTLLDLVEYVATFSSGAPIVLLALTRPDVLEERPAWATPREGATVTVLEPLESEELEELTGLLAGERQLAAADVRRLVEAAGGNPLFLEQLLALNADGAGDELVVPPTIQALLAARVDRLEPDARRLLECAAVEGRVFHRGTLVELAAQERHDAVGGQLIALVRRQFVRPLRTSEPDDAFAFVHGLMRDSAYASIAKERRAELHVQLARQLARQDDVAGELVGLHLADAVGYRRELGHDDEVTRDLARRAAERLAEGGRRALAVGDDRAAAKLLQRAAEVTSVYETLGQAVRIDLGRALEGAGRLEQARDVAEEVRGVAGRSGERVLEARVAVELARLRSRMDAGITTDELLAETERAIRVFEEDGDETGLASAWQLVHWGLFRVARYEDSLAAAERAAEHARRAQARRDELLSLGSTAMACLLGRTPAAEGLRRCDELVALAEGANLVEAFAARVRGCFLSMLGEFERGREECRRSVGLYEELGFRISALGVVCESSEVERRAGRLDEAERQLRESYDRLLEIGDVGYQAWVAAMLARVLADRGSYAEAREVARRCREELQQDHAFAQTASRLAEGIALLGEGVLDEAEAIGSEAFELALGTDMLDVQGDVLLLLADVDRSAGRDERASARVHEAVALYEQKGDLVSAETARSRLAG